MHPLSSRPTSMSSCLLLTSSSQVHLSPAYCLVIQREERFKATCCTQFLGKLERSEGLEGLKARKVLRPELTLGCKGRQMVWDGDRRRGGGVLVRLPCSARGNLQMVVWKYDFLEMMRAADSVQRPAQPAHFIAPFVPFLKSTHHLPNPFRPLLPKCGCPWASSQTCASPALILRSPPPSPHPPPPYPTPPYSLPPTRPHQHIL